MKEGGNSENREEAEKWDGWQKKEPSNRVYIVLVVDFGLSVSVHDTLFRGIFFGIYFVQ